MLHLHRADRADALVEALGRVLAPPPADPFATDVVAVPTRGMERWLAQRLSGALGATSGRPDGVCANVAFPSPRALVADAVAAACGVQLDADPWAPERLVWPLLDVVDGCLGEPWLAVLAAHLQAPDGTPRGARRLKAARHLARLFDRYALHRPQLVRGWAVGEDDGHWQAELWRRVRARLGTPSLAERLGDAAERLSADPALIELPERLSIFNLTRLPAGQLDVLRAIAAGRDVHLFLLHPSPALWARIAATLDPAAPVVRRALDPTAGLARHRLLASWGRDARELQLVLARAGGGASDRVYERERHAPASLLERLQAAIRDDAPAPGPPSAGAPDARPPLAPDDRSVQIHACHGRVRQVEVLRDALLHVLADDPALEPRDIVVMCPDIETFAPLVHATFGAAQTAPDDDDEPRAPERRPPDLRVRLADRALRQTNPVLGVIARLLELAERRCTASEVLDLADRPPVRRRFGLDDEDLARLHEWVAQSGIRWGLDAAHRAPYKLDGLAAGTWQAGLDRILLGVAMTEDGCRRYGGVLALDDVEGAAIELAGRLAELVDRLGGALRALRGPLTAEGWAIAISEAAAMVTDASGREAGQHVELGRLLDEVVDEAGGAATPLSLPEVRALLAGRLAGSATRANFRTGHLTICTMLPMRSVPH
ncbi:MAG TPA: exodeoxyribonuclease V subunit gamma, partial [Solirubrobacteraceae bacterium]|nr:exodeoxyribonuclease V subunit gamma [Solirubrobacteraceae bacterium]